MRVSVVANARALEAEETKEDDERSYGVLRDAQIAMLAQRGVKPLATLPTREWHELCVRAGLTRLSPDGHGRVPIDIGWVTAAEKSDKRPVQAFFAILLLGGIFTACYLPSTNGPNHVLTEFFAAMFGCFVSFLAAGVLPYWGRTTTTPARDALMASLWTVGNFVIATMVGPGGYAFFASYLLALGFAALLSRLQKHRHLDQKALVALCFPKGASSSSSGSRIRIALPILPEETIGLLRKVHDLALETAVTPNAIRFQEDPYRFARWFQHKTGERCDLSICVTDDHVTSIIAYLTTEPSASESGEELPRITHLS